jgi:HK97 gp10 family phage protein
MSDIQKQIKAFTVALQKKQKQAKANEKKFVTVACAEVERQAKTLMRDTVTDANKTYGKRGHHPSLPGNAPAPDTGELMRSITHEVVEENGEIIGRVGSTIKNPDYPKFLEYGTSKMKPRPWLSLAIEKSQNFMVQAFQKIMKEE